MFRAKLTGLDRKRLRLWLGLFFLALAIPTAVLVRQAYSQLKWEAFHQHRVLAEELAGRIDARFIELINAEEARTFADYAFLVVAGDPQASFVQRSPLSQFPMQSSLPGLIGHFQVDADGRFTTPLLPPPDTDPVAYGITETGRDERRSLQARIRQILGRNRLVEEAAPRIAAPIASGMVQGQAIEALRERVDVQDAEHASSKDALDASAAVQNVSQAAFDQLKASAPRENKRQEAGSGVVRVEDLDLELDPPYLEPPPADDTLLRTAQKLALLDKRGARKERSAVPEPQGATLASTIEPEASSKVRITTFESELDPFEFSRLASGHFVLFRKVWREGERYIQGALIDPSSLIAGTIESAFRGTALSRMSDLVVAYQGDVFSVFGARAGRGYLSSPEQLTGALLYRTRLSAPLGDLELVFSVTRLPIGPGAAVISWASGVLLIVLCGGFLLMYRLGTKQIDLTVQQQDFVSAVSHELKTPLTSIRMYGELLREGWASEEKKRTYYDYIFHESERLSRLIANVLQLARMTRNELPVDRRPLSVAELTDGIRSKVSSQVERAGFELSLSCDDEIEQVSILVDADYFSQIVINLVDNAIKFSAAAEKKAIDVAWRRQRDETVQLTVRDYGPGVPRDQMKKIFRLFYRSQNELTRETVGTGIGLALVHQLAVAMGGKVDVVNHDPGAAFSVSFPAVE